MIIDGFNFIYISLFIKSRFGGVFTLNKSYCSCFSIFISFSIWKVLAGYFYFERSQSNYCFKFSFKQREFPKFFTFRARDGVSVLNSLHLQSWHVLSKKAMTESVLPFSFRKIVFTGIWSQLWPFSWSSIEWGTLTWQLFPAPTTRCNSTWEQLVSRRVLKLRTTASSSEQLSATQISLQR